VKGAIRRALSAAGVIRLPWRKVEFIRKLEQVRNELPCVFGREPTVEEIAREMQLTTREVCELLVWGEQRAVMSLEEPVDEDGEITIGDMLEDTSFPAEKDGGLADALQYLTDQELAVILIRYGLGEHQVHTQQEAALVLGMSLPKVQLLDQRARLRLRRMLEEQAS
jgi:RNA polymerase primary sigma factor